MMADAKSAAKTLVDSAYAGALSGAETAINALSSGIGVQISQAVDDVDGKIATAITSANSTASGYATLAQNNAISTASKAATTITSVAVDKLSSGMAKMYATQTQLTQTASQFNVAVTSLQDDTAAKVTALNVTANSIAMTVQDTAKSLSATATIAANGVTIATQASNAANSVAITASGAVTQIASVSNSVKTVTNTLTQTANQVTQEIADRKSGDTAINTQLATMNQSIVKNATNITTLTQTANAYQVSVSSNGIRYVRFNGQGNTDNNGTHFKLINIWNNKLVDLASGLSASVSGTGSINGSGAKGATDGSTNTYLGINREPNLDSYMVFDLGSVHYDLQEIDVSMWTSTRIYYSVNVQVSLDGLAWRTVFSENIKATGTTPDVKIGLSSVSNSTVLSLFSENFEAGIKSHTGALLAGINADASGTRIAGNHIILDGDVTVNGALIAKLFSTADATVAKTLTIGSTGALKISYTRTDAFDGYGAKDIPYTLSGSLMLNSGGLSFSGSSTSKPSATDPAVIDYGSVPYVLSSWNATALMNETAITLKATSVKGSDVRSNGAAVSIGDSELNISAFSLGFSTGSNTTYIDASRIFSTGMIEANSVYSDTDVMASGSISGKDITASSSFNVGGTKMTANNLTTGGDINLGWTLRKNGTGFYPAHFNSIPGIHIAGTNSGIVINESANKFYVVMGGHWNEMTMTGNWGTGTWDN